MNISDLLTKALIIIFVISFVSFSMYYFYSTNYHTISYKTPQQNKLDVLNNLAKIISSAYFGNAYEYSVLVNIGSNYLYVYKILNANLEIQTDMQYMIIPISFISLGFSKNLSTQVSEFASDNITYILKDNSIMPLIFYNLNYTKTYNNKNEYFLQIIYLTSNSSYVISNENEITFEFIKKTAQITWIMLNNETLVCRVNNYTIFQQSMAKGDIVTINLIKITLSISTLQV